MDSRIPTKRYIFLTFLTVVILLSVPIALLSYIYYGIVARGILGVSCIVVSVIFLWQIHEHGCVDKYNVIGS